MNIFLSLMIAVSAVLHIRADYANQRKRVFLFKPLTMGLIILLALRGKDPASDFYRWAVVAGLLFSLAGDVFLMVPGDKFQAGLVSFLVAHLWYIAAFSNPAGFYWSLVGLAPFLGLGTAVYAYLWPGLGRMRVPALVYMLAIVVMAWQGLGLWQQTGQAGALPAFGGGLLFVVSDSVLAINRFRRPFRAVQIVVMSTYFAAQWLIALSTNLPS